jgi:cytoskeletal protein CcmA (bactofilin family)
MWKSSQREDEVSTPEKETSTPSSKSIPAASAPSSAAEALRSHSVLSHPTTFVGKSLVVKGDLSGKEALLVDGEVEGSITLDGQRLTVRPNGRIRGNIEAGHVILQGRVDGNIQAGDRVELFKSASFTGDMLTARISIEEGAFFKGKLDIKKPETAPMIAPKPRATAAIPVASTSQQGSLLEGVAKKSGKSWYKQLVNHLCQSIPRASPTSVASSRLTCIFISIPRYSGTPAVTPCTSSPFPSLCGRMCPYGWFAIPLPCDHFHETTIWEGSA